MPRRPVYLRNDQWALVDALLAASEYNIEENLRVSVRSRTVRVALCWSRDQIIEIRKAISIPAPERSRAREAPEAGA
jgi:hypothetical protein